MKRHFISFVVLLLFFCFFTIAFAGCTALCNHEYAEPFVLIKATCQTPGTYQYTCSLCGTNYTEEYYLKEISASDIYSQALNYIGEIITYDRNGEAYKIGTGIVYSSDGEILTNYHVIDGALSAKITINSITYNIQSIVAYNENIDLAIIKINSSNLPVAQFCDLPVLTGNLVYAMGSSKGFTNTMSQGIVTHSDRIVDGLSYIQHDAAISGGNSGGALLNTYGEVIGINTFTYDDSQNLNFAVPSSAVKELQYIPPVSLYEFYWSDASDPFEVLKKWVLEDGYSLSNGSFCIEDSYQNYTRFLIYNPPSESFKLRFTAGEGGLVMTFTLEILTGNKSYYYASSSNNGRTLCSADGYIDCPSFTSQTQTYLKNYSGSSDYRPTFRIFVQTAVGACLDWLSEELLTNNIRTTLSDIGFSSYP